MIRLIDITKSYRTEEIETLALNKVNLEIYEGDFVAIMGPSGCGKSTLLNIIGMLDTASEGHYLFRDEDVARYSEAQLSLIRKKHIGFIFQNFNLIDELNIEENIELALLYHKIPSSVRKHRVIDILDKVGMAHRAKHMPSQLSGGQQQRVAVARAVVAEQSIILADEPTGNLDTAHGKEVMEMLRGLNKEGTTIVMVTHSPTHAGYATRTINFLDGHVIGESQNSANIQIPYNRTEALT